MSDSVKKVAGLVGIVALGFATWGIGTLVVGGASLTAAAGTSVFFGSAFALSFGTIATIGLVGLSIATMPSLPIDQTGAGDRGTPAVDPDAVAVYAFGTTMLPSLLVYEESYYPDAPYPRKHLTDVFCHCWHRIQAYTTFTIGTVNGPTAVTFAAGGAVTSPAALTNFLSWRRVTGTQTQSLVDSPGGLDGIAWPDTAIGEGVTHSALTHAYEEQFYQDLFGGTPRQIEIVAQCAWLYDPRLDPTYGSGSQDYVDPTTWTFNNGNAALVLLRAIIGEYAGTELVWGRGAPESEINMASFVAMANIADETVDSKPRFRLGGVHHWDGNWQAFVQRWEQETGGKLSKSGGKYTVWLPHDDLTSITTLTEAKLIEGVAIEHTIGGLEGLYNTARGRYIEPTEGYVAFPYPEVTESTAVTADGGKRILMQEFSWVQDVSIAERIARIKVRRSRYQRVWIVGLGWEGHGPNYEVFTVHTLNTKDTNEVNELVRVIDRQLMFDGTTVLILQEENAAIYDDSIALGTPNTADPLPNYTHPVVPRYMIAANGFIANGDFEVGVFTPWDTAGGAVIQNTVVFAGSWALETIDGVDDTWGPWVGATAGNIVSVTGFAQRKASDLPDGDLVIVVECQEADGTPTGTISAAVDNGIAGWQAFLVTGTLPALTERIRVVIDTTTNITTGNWYVDTLTGVFNGADGSAGADGDDGVDGDDGLSVYVANVYLRSASAPSTPTGGSYDFSTQILTPPASWFATPPAGSNPLYVSTASFSVVGQTGVDSSTTWSTPAILVEDGADGAPGAPGSDGNDGADGADGTDASNWAYSGTFSPTDADTVAWGAGTLTDTLGATYSIGAGNTGNMAAPTYIYWDPASPTVFGTTTTPGSAVGAGKILIGVAQNAATGTEAFYFIFGATSSPVLFTAGQIAANTITANKLAAVLTFTHELILDTLGKLHSSGKDSYADTTAGVYIGWDATEGAYVLNVGDATDFVKWDGTNLEIGGQLNFTNVQTFTPTWTGFSSAPSGDLSYIDAGQVVYMWNGTGSDLTGTSNATSMSITNLPSALLPSASTIFPGMLVQCRDNGNAVYSNPNVSSAGTLNFARLDTSAATLIPGGLWTNSGTKGLRVGTSWMWSKIP